MWLPVTCPENYEASGLGAAIDASVGLKLHPDFNAAITAMVRHTHTIEPTPRTHEMYDHLFRTVYQPMYRNLRSFYQAMQKMDGNHRR